MYYTKKQTGSAHAVIIIVLVVALLGALGWIFWQNFVSKDDATENTNETTVIGTDKTEAITKTYSNTDKNVSFDYPSNWTVSEMTMEDQLMVTVKDTNGNAVAYLGTNLQVGGAGDASDYSTLASSKATANDGYVCATYIASYPENSRFFYGLSTNKNVCGSVNNGSVTLPETAQFIETDNDLLGTISFGNQSPMDGAESSVNDEAAAKAFVASDEYAQIQTMIASLKY